MRSPLQPHHEPRTSTIASAARFDGVDLDRRRRRQQLAITMRRFATFARRPISSGSPVAIASPSLAISTTAASIGSAAPACSAARRWCWCRDDAVLHDEPRSGSGPSRNSRRDFLELRRAAVRTTDGISPQETQRSGDDGRSVDEQPVKRPVGTAHGGLAAGITNRNDRARMLRTCRSEQPGSTSAERVRKRKCA